jgi:hypothetical protein
MANWIGDTVDSLLNRGCVSGVFLFGWPVALPRISARSTKAFRDAKMLNRLAVPVRPGLKI